MFAVNPLGVQADGTLVEGTTSTGGSFEGLSTARETADLSPDFVFDSKGRLTASGYEIEVRIPFKSLRYPQAETQDWGINVVRRVQSLGHEDTWTPARRAAASFLAPGRHPRRVDGAAPRPGPRPQSRSSPPTPTACRGRAAVGPTTPAGPRRGATCAGA